MVPCENGGTAATGGDTNCGPSPQAYPIHMEMEAHDSASEVSDDELQGLSPQDLKKAIRWEPAILEV